MDPLTASTALATIVSLICNFKQESRDNNALQTKDFIAYLDRHRFEDLKEFILRSTELSSEIDLLLKQDTELILAKLDQIDGILGSLMSQVTEIKGLARVIRPQSEVSDQAISILIQLRDSGAEQFIHVRHLGGIALMLPGGRPLAVQDERFLEDDLRSLASLGLLIPRDAGDHLAFSISRQTIKYLSLLQK
jgi:hypothetical protein